MDIFADVLQTVHLQSTLLYRSRIWGARGIQFDAAGASSADAIFHVVTTGRCQVQLTGAANSEPITLEAGDCVVLPRGDAHVLRSEAGCPARPLNEWLF